MRWIALLALAATPAWADDIDDMHARWRAYDVEQQLNRIESAVQAQPRAVAPVAPATAGQPAAVFYPVQAPRREGCAHAPGALPRTADGVHYCVEAE